MNRPGDPRRYISRYRPKRPGVWVYVRVVVYLALFVGIVLFSSRIGQGAAGCLDLFGSAR